METKDKTKKIEDFLTKVSNEIYSEPNTDMHKKMIDQLIPDLETDGLLDFGWLSRMFDPMSGFLTKFCVRRMVMALRAPGSA